MFENLLGGDRFLATTGSAAGAIRRSRLTTSSYGRLTRLRRHLVLDRGRAFTCLAHRLVIADRVIAKRFLEQLASDAGVAASAARRSFWLRQFRCQLELEIVMDDHAR